MRPVRPSRVPIDGVLATEAFATVAETVTADLVEVGPRLRLAVTREVSVAVAPPYRAVTARLGREQARLLLPKCGIVPFGGRDGDLNELRSWCVDGAESALRMVTGSGGSGKTRLAAEACVRMLAQGWQAGFADPKAPDGRAELAFDRPTLLVVDDADLNVTLLADLVRTVGYWPPGAPPVRLLLLARHTVGWWDTLNRRTDQLAAELADPPLVLHDGELPLADRAELHTRAVSAFVPHLPDAVTGADEGQPPLLTDAAFANPLLVHMHALLTVAGADVPTICDAVRERMLDAVLDRERARWEVTFPDAAIDAPTSRLPDLLALALIHCPQPAAAATLGRGGPAGGRADRERGSRRHLPGAGHSPAGRVQPEPRDDTR